MADRAAQIVVRIPMNGDPLEEVIERHNAVASAFESVLFGVRGQAPRKNRTDSLLNQVHRKVPTFLYVVQVQRPQIRAFRAPLLWLGDTLSSSDLEQVPPYYSTLLPAKPVVLWLKVGRSQEIAWKRLSSYQMEYTGTSLEHVLMKSMGSVLIVADGAHAPVSITKTHNI